MTAACHAARIHAVEMLAAPSQSITGASNNVVKGEPEFDQATQIVDTPCSEHQLTASPPSTRERPYRESIGNDFSDLVVQNLVLNHCSGNGELFPKLLHPFAVDRFALDAPI